MPAPEQNTAYCSRLAGTIALDARLERSDSDYQKFEIGRKGIAIHTARRADFAVRDKLMKQYG
jgi:hypothetical protein